MKRLILILLVCHSSLANASWTLVAESKDGKFYIDNKTIQNHNNFIRAWVKSEYHTSVNGMLSSRQLYEYDCKEKKTRDLSFQSFKKNNLEDLDNSFHTPTEWKFIPPGTIHEIYLKIVCKIK